MTDTAVGSARAATSAESPPGLLIERPAQVATLSGGLRRGAAQADVAALTAGPGEALAVAAWRGLIVAAGALRDVHRQIVADGLSLDDFERLDATGTVVTPGLIDAHTHLLFGGTREEEWQLRQRGADYLEILAAGGGILSTVAATRAATDEALLAHGRRWLGAMLRQGTTTVEAKSGYGLDTSSELRLLALAGRLGGEGPVEIVPTYLGAHAVPPELRGRPDGAEAYVRQIVEEQLPAVARQGVARSCDAFCEREVFDAGLSRRVMEAARGLGLGVRLHADQVSSSGGAELAAELGCLSADHLDAISPAGIEALARAAAAGQPVVATLLPVAGWFLRSAAAPPARRLIEAGVPVALATDFNPGTSPTPSLPLVMSVACIEFGLSPAEALAAVTVNAAHALGLGARLGSIERGKAADLVVWQVPRLDQIPYWLAGGTVGRVVKAGRLVGGA